MPNTQMKHTDLQVECMEPMPFSLPSWVLCLLFPFGQILHQFYQMVELEKPPIQEIEEELTNMLMA